MRNQPKLIPSNRVIVHWSTWLEGTNPGSPWNVSWAPPRIYTHSTSTTVTPLHRHVQHTRLYYKAVQSLIQQVFRVFAAESSTTSTPYISQNKKVTLYADSALHIATGHLLLSHTSVRGVEVPKDGLRLRITCNNFNDSTMSTKGTRRAYPIWVYNIPTSRRMHLVSSKDGVRYLTFA